MNPNADLFNIANNTLIAADFRYQAPLTRDAAPSYRAVLQSHNGTVHVGVRLHYAPEGQRGIRIQTTVTEVDGTEQHLIGEDDWTGDTPAEHLQRFFDSI